MAGLEGKTMKDDKLCISPDALIAMIVTEAQDRALAQMPGPEAPLGEVQASAAFLHRMDALVRTANRGANRQHLRLAFKRFLVALATALSLFSCTMLPVKAVREAVVETLLEWHDQFVTVSFSDGDASPVPDFKASLSYIPQGFTLVEASAPALTQHYYAQYADASGRWFAVRIAPINDTQAAINNENAAYYSLQFDGHDAIWCVMNADNSNVLVWESDRLAYSMTGDLDITELIKIADGIVLDTL